MNIVTKRHPDKWDARHSRVRAARRAIGRCADLLCDTPLLWPGLHADDSKCPLHQPGSMFPAATCRKGHILEGDNLRMRYDGGKTRRECRPCRRERSRKHNQKLSARRASIVGGC